MHLCNKHAKILDVSKLDKKQVNAAKRDLKLKLDLEKKLERDLRKFMNRISNDFKNKYMASGQILDFQKYAPDLSFILRQSYDRAQKEFKGLSLKKQDDDPLLLLGLSEWQAQRLETQPQVIMETAQKDASKSVQQAQQEVIDDGSQFSAIDLAISAFVLLKRRLFARISGIAITETQAASESTKLISAQVASGRIPFTVIADPFALTRPREQEIAPATKSWVTVGDANVRATHVAADGQNVSIDDPFIVGGFRMRHPGDLSLGAPIREWINCRCTSTMNIDF